MEAGFALFYLVAIGILSWIAVSSSSTGSTGEDSYHHKNHPREGAVKDCYMGDIFEASIGISILNLCSLDLASKTFYSEGILWLKYADLPDWLDHWDEEIIECPVKALRFVNNVDRHDLTLELEPSKPVKDSDGLFIQWVKFSGRFVANQLDLRRFPFETIQLPIEVELEDMYASETNLIYRQSGALVATGGELTGYKFKRAFVSQWIHRYRTNWGWTMAISGNGGDNLAEFDNIRACVDYSRSVRSSVLGVFLPLAIMICIVLCVPLIDIHQHENRVVIPASVLLVLVFLQDGYKKILPAGLSYPTLADLIYAACFVLTIGVFVSGVVTANAYLASTGSVEAAARSINAQSHIIFLINIAYLVIAISSLIALTGRKTKRPLP